ncbi:hypothetical protein [Pseudarthrobacter sp. AG30]|uniref:hypothetical protein n=1 Tax=Pseudarthrobacter sp. AG30 TaxID=2249742 RepID=UPI001057FBE5|nr:hypothetical protein [Pseudarthrobacter sp. AG30]
MKLISPPLVNAGFEVSRADLTINQHQILKDIVVGIAKADIVIADVTDLNGNVMYELGLAHAMGRRTVMITRDIESLPFDLRAYRATQYSTEFDEAPKLMELIESVARGVLDGSAEFSNPVQDFAPEVLGKSEQVSVAPVSLPLKAGRGSSEAVAEPPPAGLLDIIVELSEEGDLLQGSTQAISEATVKIGETVAARSAQIEKTNKNLGAKAAPVLRQLMKETAKDFQDFNERLVPQNELLRESGTKIGHLTNSLARLRNATSEEEVKRLRDEIDSLTNAEAQFAGAHASVTAFAEVLLGLPNMERTLSTAVQETTVSVLDTAGIIELLRAEFARARSLMEEKLNRVGV